MRALVIAAGRSTRLYPLTEKLPKCLLPVGDKTILDHQVEALVACGVTELVVVVGCMKELIIEHLKKKAYPMRITFVENDEYATSGPVWSISKATAYLEAPLVFFHSDVLFETDALKSLLAHPDETVMLYRPGAWDEEAGKLIVKDGAVAEMGKHIGKDRASGEYLQIAKFGPSFVHALKDVLTFRLQEGRDGFTIDAFGETARIAHATPLPYDGTVLEIDTVEDYEHAKEVWRNRP